MIQIDTWTNCYDLNWKNLITPAAFSHPAKFSHGLIKRIYEHALAEGMIQPGGVVLDPFGGVGLGALYAATCGLSWIGVELEDKFTTLSRQNFIEWSERLWCTCGENGNSYLRSMRESVAKVGVGNEQDQKAQDGAVLQSGLPQQISLFGKEAFTGTRRGIEGAQALEQREALESGDAPNLVKESNGRQQDDGEKRQLEGGQADSEGWVYRDTGERGEKIGTPALNGDEFRPKTEPGRVSTSQEWEQAGQPLGELGTNDNIQAHGDTSPEWSEAESEGEAMRDMRPNLSEQTEYHLQPGVQAAAESRILAATRRQEEGAACPDCGKLIVPFPVILQGDSRRLTEVVGAAGLVVSSPPYADITNIGGRRDPNKSIEAEKRYRANHPELEGIRPKALEPYGDTPGQLGAMKPGDIEAVISSPPFAGNSGGRGDASRNGIDSALFDRHSGGMKGGTGSDPANLDHLPMGRVEAVIGSPPFGSVVNHDGGPVQQQEGKLHSDYGSSNGQLASMVVGSPPFADSVGSDDPDKRGGLFRDAKRRNDTNLTGTYGETEGQLGGMKAGVAVVSSPPFENQNACNDPKHQTGRTTNGGPLYGDYGSTVGQIGATQGDTFWAAARLIVEQCYDILPPNACAIWVVKNYIKAGREVDFTGQWQALCEACGFETVHIHRAMLVKDNGEQETMAAGHDTTGTTTNLLGEEVTTAGKPMLNKKNIVARKSFFRRLHERKNPHLAIDFETVLCMKKAA